MNILCLDQYGELGGAQRCLLDLIPGLAQRGWSVHVAAPGSGQLIEYARLHATTDEIRCGPYSSGRKTPRDMLRFASDTRRLSGEIRALAERYAADLIYVNGPRLLPAAARAARRGPPVLFHSHSLLAGNALWLAGRSIARLRAAVVASCRFVAAPLLRYADERGIRVVYNGVAPLAVSKRDPAGAEFRIGTIGRIAPEKGQAEFLRAARILHGEMPQSKFVICGAPLFSSPAAARYADGLRELADGLPVEFTGWREDVARMLATLDLLVVPSTAVDATPRVILEAFAAGVPVMAFASGGIPELVEHDVTGFLVEDRSAEALARAIGDRLRDPERMHAVAEAALGKARGEFSLERYQRHMAEAIAAAAGVSSPNRDATIQV